MDRTDPLLLQILGKIEALELLMECLLVGEAQRELPDAPTEYLKKVRQMLFSTLQNLERDEGELAAVVWDERSEALDLMIDNAVARLKGD